MIFFLAFSPSPHHFSNGPSLKRGRQGRQEPAGDRYWSLLETGIVAKFETFLHIFKGLQLTTYFAMSWPSLGFIRQISSEKSGAQVLQVGFKLWSVAKSATKGILSVRFIFNQPINASRPLRLGIWSTTVAMLIVWNLPGGLELRFSRRKFDEWSPNSATTKRKHLTSCLFSHLQEFFVFLKEYYFTS